MGPEWIDWKQLRFKLPLSRWSHSHNKINTQYYMNIVFALEDSTVGCLWLLCSRLALRLYIYKDLCMYNIQRGIYVKCFCKKNLGVQL